MLLEGTLFFALGALVGAAGAFMGIGGGILLIPVFLFGYGYPAQQTVGTSLVVVFFNALSGTAAYFRQKLVFMRAAIQFGLATVPGALLGSYAASYFSGNGFSLAFGSFLLLMAALMSAKRPREETARFDPQTFAYCSGLGVTSSLFVGFLASALGVGGGIIHVPFMTYVLGFPIHVAVATSTCILAISSLAGVVTHCWLGHVLWLPAVGTGLGAVFGAQIGARLAARAKPAHMAKALALLVAALGCKFLWSAL